MGLSALGTPCFTPVVTLGITAAIRKKDGQSVDQILAFSAIAYLNLITIPLLVLVGRLPNIVGAYTAVKQIDDFLNNTPSKQAMLPDGPPTEKGSMLKKSADQLESREEVVVIAECSLQPDLDKEPVLHDLNILIACSTFTFIVGPSASGKTLLIEAILGEHACSQGSLSSTFAAQDIAYAAQRPWLRSGTMKNNIVGAAPLDELYYQKVLWACALDHDAGHIRDSPSSGGNNLSGGQRQKVVSTENSCGATCIDLSSRRIAVPGSCCLLTPQAAHHR